MLIKNLKLTNYRSHQKASWEFDPKITYIYGPNGSGKTNILEAIHLLATTKPFRGEYDHELISHNEKFLRIDACLNSEDGEKLLELVVSKTDFSENSAVKKVKINKVAKTLHKFAGTIKTVLFCPEDIGVLTGSPGERRRIMDAILYQISYPYKKAHSDYTKALRQRNKLLEMILETGVGRDQLDFWNNALLKTGRIIQDERKSLFAYLEIQMAGYEHTLNKTPTSYAIFYDINELTSERLVTYKEKEILAHTTLIGPHRDDFEIRIDQKNIAHFGSRGQQRTALLALKLSEIDYIYGTTQQHPVLLLDDIFSELDKSHREAVLDTIKDKQVIITGADPEINVEKLYINKTINLP